MLLTHLRNALGKTVHWRLRVEVIAPPRSIARRKHRRALFFEPLLGAVIQSRNAWQGHDQGQALSQGEFVAAF